MQKGQIFLRCKSRGRILDRDESRLDDLEAKEGSSKEANIFFEIEDILLRIVAD